MKQKKVLILGGSALQIPAIRKARDLGFYVICSDYDEHALGFEFSDQAEVISTLDIDGILRLATEEAVDFVITSTSDAPVRTAAYVSEQLDLPIGISYANAIAATQKDVMRDRLSDAGVPVPRYVACATEGEFALALEQFEFRCVVKPADSAASRGVVLVDKKMNRDEIGRLFAETVEYSRKGVAMVEELMCGPEVSVEAMTVHGATTVIAVTDKQVTEPPYFVELGHSEPSRLSAECVKRIKEVTNAAVEAIGIETGPSHTEIIVTAEGPKVVEIAARLGGDFITSRLVPLSTGVDLVGASVAYALGQETDFSPILARGSAIGFITSDGGIIESIRLDDDIYDIEGLEEIEFYRSPGERISQPHSSNDRIGHIICSGESVDEALKSLNAARAKIAVEVTDV